LCTLTEALLVACSAGSTNTNASEMAMLVLSETLPCALVAFIQLLICGICNGLASGSVTLWLLWLLS
jgi:hypothetical protein